MSLKMSIYRSELAIVHCLGQAWRLLQMLPAVTTRALFRMETGARFIAGRPLRGGRLFLPGKLTLQSRLVSGEGCPKTWRRGRDSNPRKDYSFTGLANLRFRPLSHLSSGPETQTPEIFSRKRKLGRYRYSTVFNSCTSMLTIGYRWLGSTSRQRRTTCSRPAGIPGLC